MAPRSSARVGAGSSTAPCSSTCSLGHLQFISQTVLGICKNRAWGCSITSGVFLFKAESNAGKFWDVPRLVAGAEGHIRTRLLHGVEGRNKPFPSSLPLTRCPCKAVKNSWKALGGGEGSRTLMWTQGKGGAAASARGGISVRC